MYILYLKIFKYIITYDTDILFILISYSHIKCKLYNLKSYSSHFVFFCDYIGILNIQILYFLYFRNTYDWT